MITIQDLNTLREQEQTRHATALAALQTVEGLALAGLNPVPPTARQLIAPPAEPPPLSPRAKRKVKRAVKALQRAAAPARAPRPGSQLDQILNQAREWGRTFTVKEMATALRLDQHRVGIAICALAKSGHLTRAGRAQYALAGQARPATPRQPLTPPGTFVPPRPRPSQLTAAVRLALTTLKSPWQRIELEQALDPEDARAGRQDGALAAVLAHLRETGVIERLGGHGDEALYRTGQPKE